MTLRFPKTKNYCSSISIYMRGGAGDGPSTLLVVSRKLALFLKSRRPAPQPQRPLGFLRAFLAQTPKKCRDAYARNPAGVRRKAIVRAETRDPPQISAPHLQLEGFRKERVFLEPHYYDSHVVI